MTLAKKSTRILLGKAWEKSNLVYYKSRNIKADIVSI